MQKAIDCFKNLHAAATTARATTNETHQQELAGALQSLATLMLDELEGGGTPAAHVAIAGAAFGDEEPTGVRMAQGERVAELEAELAAARAELAAARVELTEARRAFLEAAINDVAQSA